MTQNQKGFSIVEGLLILAVIGLVAGTGWYVWQASQKKQQSSSENQSNVSQLSESTNPDFTPDPMVYVKSYELPTGWKSKSCKENVIAIIPQGSIEPNCEADQPNSIVTISAANIDIGDTYKLPTNCDEAKKNYEYDLKSGYKGTINFSCTNVAIDGKNAFKTVAETSKESFEGEAIRTTYNVKVAESNILSIDYLKYKTPNTVDYNSQFNQLVSSIKLN